jgi:DNA helicase-2/ATP-dependent DNA helicase PcrA
MNNFLEELNAVQHKAVTDFDGPTLIIAGAGSGKTRVLTCRIAYLLMQGVAAKNILSLTFTNKAAKEMKERITHLVSGDQARQLWMGTFHSVFARILRMESEAIGYPATFSIYDSQDAKNLIKQIIKEMQLDDQKYKANDVYGRISMAKNNLITAKKYGQTEMYKQDAATKRGHIAEIYSTYNQRCRKSNAMDFDDILLNMNILLRDNTEVLDKYQRIFRYILVDEYQDTNLSQYTIVKKLAAQHNNVCVVGDDAQSIYAFRGARIENILNFRNDYPNYKIHKLEQNYRSTQTIVNAANTLIEKNRNRIKKVVFSKNDIGEKIRVFGVSSDQEEGFLVANSILEMKIDYELNYKDFAILYRTNAQSRIFEEALRKRNIPYKIYGGLSFYERKEIKDVLAYAKLVVNPNDDSAFLRVINFPARGIGATTIARLEKVANTEGISLWDTAIRVQNLVPDISSAIRTKLHKFTNFIKDFAKGKDTTDAYDLLSELIRQSGIISAFKAEHTPENISRLENIDELLNGIRIFVDENALDNQLVTLEQYLANVSLLTNADNEKDEDKDKVTVMTIHSSKGLEFEITYIVGMEENLFPSQMSSSSEAEVEEERRLFYVALTRARKRVFLLHSEMRFRWGTMVYSAQSRFIREIDSEYIDDGKGRRNNVKIKPSIPQQRPIFVDNNLSKNAITQVNQQNAQAQTHAAAQWQEDDHRKIRAGMIVEHYRLGIGQVLEIDNSSKDIKARIDFKNEGQKLLLLKFAKLKVVG